MLNIFISWSGDRSRAIADFLTQWLRKVIQISKPWMSDFDIEKGKRWADEIGKNLSSHDVGIICVTPENYKASWMIFEAGALSKSIGHAKVCPLLLGMSPSELGGPLTQFQATVFNKKDFFKLVKTLNVESKDLKLEEKILKDAFERNWPELEEKINEITKIEISGSRTQVSRVIKAFARYGLPEPIMGSQAFFSSGFESHGLYSVLTETAKNRLYIFGRKNRKLFDKEHRDFFVDIRKRISSGLDFKVLFLDPNSPEHVIRAAHQDDDFKLQLEQCIKVAKKILSNTGITIEDHFRMYDVQRTTACMVVDDAVLYAPIAVDEMGRVKKMTKSPFSIINANSDFGKELIGIFNSHWNCSNPINKNEGRTCQST